MIHTQNEIDWPNTNSLSYAYYAEIISKNDLWWINNSEITMKDLDNIYYDHKDNDIIFPHYIAVDILVQYGFGNAQAIEKIGNRYFIYGQELSGMVLDSRHCQ